MRGISYRTPESIATLLVDDEAWLRAVIAEFLIEAGIKVFEANNADEAMQLLNARSDIVSVLTDVEMPGSMTGAALAATISGRCPAIVATPSRSLLSSAVLPEGTEFIPKPFDANEFVTPVRRRAQKLH